MTAVLEREPLSLQRRWLVIALATVAMQFAYWPVVYSVAAAGVGDEGAGTAGALALGLALVPLAFIVLAFGSRHPRAPGAVLRAMGVFVLAVSVLVFVDVVVGMVAGIALGGAVALRRDDDVSIRWRLGGAGLATLYVLLLLLVVPPLALVTGASIPFAVTGIVDQMQAAR